MTKKDNSTFVQKVALRRAVLREVADPVVMETHGGVGKLYRACYASIVRGIVFEKDPRKAELLAGQRSTWSVYEADCVAALHSGAGAHLSVNILDVDPYGAPWPVLQAFFTSERPRADKLWIVVNDGLRHKITTGSAWTVKSLQSAVCRFGNDVHGRYLEVCRFLLNEQAAQAGYSLSRFSGYYCGHAKQMTHYAALLER